MVGDLKVRGHRLAEALDFYIITVIRANGHRGIDDIGEDHHDLPDLLLQLALFGLQSSQLVSLGFHLGFDGLRLLELAGVLLSLAHEHTHLLAEGVALGAELTGTGNGVPVLLVQGQDLVNQGQLCLLELVFDVLLDDVRIVPDEFDIQHSCYLESVCMGRHPALLQGALGACFT